MEDLRRQLWIAGFTILIIIPVGIVGFMRLEGWSFLDSAYVTIITLSTIGYGDIVPKMATGRLFAIILAVSGLTAYVFTGQAIVQFVTSPVLRAARQRRRTQNQIDKLRSHYIICGMGEMVNKTIEYLQQGAEARRSQARKQTYDPIDRFLDRIFGDDEDGHVLWLRRPIQSFIFYVIDTFLAQDTILDIVVVITQDEDYAQNLRDTGLLVIEGQPTDDVVLTDAGLFRAQAIMVLLDNDTETLLTVLTAHNLAPTVQISAAVMDADLSKKVTRVGASAIITPYGTAGQFLNSATLRPAVNDFYNGLLFEHNTLKRLTQLELYDDSPWIGQSIGSLQLHKEFNTDVIGIRHEDATFSYVPPMDHVLQEDETLIVVAPGDQVDTLKKICRGGTGHPYIRLWQPLPQQEIPIRSEKTYTLAEAEDAISSMSKHFIICGNDRVARSAISKIDPERPFAIISNDSNLTNDLLKRGFRVVHGDPALEDTLIRAGVKRAQAIMVALEKKADSVITVLSSRTLNRNILITATANTDDMIDKLERAGADRVVSPFHVAARFVVLTTTRPQLADFVNYILYNVHSGLETTELYMENDSEWIGKTVEELDLLNRYSSGIIGIRLPDRQTFIYAPPGNYVIQPNEVLIIVEPILQLEAIRADAYGGTHRAPTTLRSRVLQSSSWTRDQIQELINRHNPNN